MVIQTKTPYSSKGKIWMKFVTGDEEFERFFKVTFQGIQKGNFFYEVEGGFPKEMVKLIFGLGAVVVR